MTNTRANSRLLLTGAFLASAGFAGSAMAGPIVCNSTITLGGGSGYVLDSALGAGVCVQTANATFGDFNLSTLPTGGRVAFSTTNFGTPEQAYLGISFNDNFLSGNTYIADYSVEISSGPNLLDSLNADFTQDNGTSTLMTKIAEAGGSGSIDWSKVGSVGTGPDLISYDPGLVRFNVTNSLQDGGSISALSNDAVEDKSTPVDEPSSIALLITGTAGLSIFGLTRRPRKMMSEIN